MHLKLKTVDCVVQKTFSSFSSYKLTLFRSVNNTDALKHLTVVLPFLAKTVLPTLATRALSGVGLALAQNSTNKVMGNGLHLKKGSNIARVETDGQDLYLKPQKGSGLGMVGDGLYLKQGGQVISGHGLLFGPNSPLKNIPVLGWLL